MPLGFVRALRWRTRVSTQVHTRLQVGDPKEDKASVQFLAERAELLLRVANSHGLRSRQQALEWLGSHFRVALMAPQHMSDMQASSATALWDLREALVALIQSLLQQTCQRKVL
jgi:aryl-alcohol dehydrogenase-like predicted oxidoreductase